MAHPVRPDSYAEINNFYTATVYEKGAEVIRMQRTLLGAEAFRRGIDLYFERHDGQAVTCDDFVQAMQDASGVDLDQFRRWYAQAGTPTLDDPRTIMTPLNTTITLGIDAGVQPTHGQPRKVPAAHPAGDRTRRVPTARSAAASPNAASADAGLDHHGGLHLRQASESFRFVDVPSRRCRRCLRGFSAPVKVDSTSTSANSRCSQRTTPIRSCRWDAAQRIFSRAPSSREAVAAARGAALRWRRPCSSVVGVRFSPTGERSGAARARAASTAAFASLPISRHRSTSTARTCAHGGDGRAGARALGRVLRAVFAAHRTADSVLADPAAGRATVAEERLPRVSWLRAAIATSHALALAQFDADDNMTDTHRRAGAR